MFCDRCNMLLAICICFILPRSLSVKFGCCK